MLEILAYGLAGTSVLLSAVDIYDTRPEAWLDGAERLLRTRTGRRVYFARTGSPEEVDRWVADHDGTTDIDPNLRADIERALGKDA